MPSRFQQRRAKGWRKPPGGRCVSRPSRYGNPFEVPTKSLGDPVAHAEAKAKYRKWITAPEQADRLVESRRELRGRDLGCYCPVGLPCHADVLLELVND
jgi:hypothetical protein